MHVEKNQISKTELTLTITVSAEELAEVKQDVLKRLAKTVKAPGFREGKVPAQVAEKHLDPTAFQTEFLDEAMTRFYANATLSEKIRPVTQPKVNVKKFVPFTALEYEVTTSIVGDINLGEYKGLKVTVAERKVTDDDLKSVIENLRERIAQKNEVKRAAKAGDEATIDFEGKDTKGKAIKGADGKDYPLVLGSNAFIPGFEDNVVGMKPGEKKDFTLTFPKEYGVKALASKKVTFTVTLKKLSELKKPDVNDEFAASVGPFKTVSELEEDIKKQLQLEADQENLRALQNELVNKVVESSSVDLPDELVDQQLNFELEDLRRNLTYRGQTYQEFLEFEGTTDEAYKEEILRPRALNQVKTAFVLTEIAEKENIEVTPEELEVQIQMLKAQYTDQAMQGELDKSEARRDIAGRLLSQKVVNFIVSEAQSK